MNEKTRCSGTDAELEREIREGRKFTLEEAIARLIGPGALKGESPISRLHQAEAEIASWLRSNLADAGGALEVVLHRRVKGSEFLLNNFEQPLVVLAAYCKQVLDSDYQLRSVVREADLEWGRMMGERPHFEKDDAPHHPDDPYTTESVRQVLTDLMQQLAAQERCEHREK